MLRNVPARAKEMQARAKVMEAREKAKETGAKGKETRTKEGKVGVAKDGDKTKVSRELLKERVREKEEVKARAS